MAQIGITKETKTKLLDAAANGNGIDSWMFQFIRHDPEFQGVLFRTAENVQNWRFLESLSEYRAQQRRAASPPVASQQSPRSGIRRQPAEPWRPHEPKRLPAQKGRHKTRPRTQLPPPLDPKTLPPHMVSLVTSTTFTNCPRCKLRLLRKVLSDHLELSCPHRGRVDGPVVGLMSTHQKYGTSVVFCRCGAPAIPGDSCCYDHKPT